MENNTIIKVDNLKKHFPIGKKSPFKKNQEWVKAVDGVSFEVKKGETFGIVGESGSGKSTVARLINHLIVPSDGKIMYKGKNIAQEMKRKERMEIRRSIQMVFQSPFGTLDPRKTIEFSLKEPFQIHKIGTKAEQYKWAKELLEIVGLPSSSLNKYPHEFSGGQLQRINIARAISLKPEVVICDESVSALDVSVQAQILNLLNDLQKELNLTYIFISHDLNVVRYMCDHIAVMHFGKIVEQGTAEEIYEQPKAEYTKTLLSAIPIDSPYERKR